MGAEDTDFEAELDAELDDAFAAELEETLRPAQTSSGASLMPEMFIAFDLIFESGLERSDNAPNQAQIREIEFGFNASIDPYFYGVVSVVLENEGGEMIADLHESYIRYSGLMRGLVLRAGKLFLDMGVMNTIHQHDRPFVDSPFVQREMFDYEAAADIGLDASLVLHALPFYTRLSLGIFNGQVFGHAHTSGTPKKFPLITTRAETYFDIGEDAGVRLGANHLIRSLDREDGGLYHQQFGFDMTFRAFDRKEGGLLVLAEYWNKLHTTNNRRVHGMYLLGSWRFNTIYELGLRYDYLKVLEPVPVVPTRAVSGIATLKPSEFSYLRLQYTYQDVPTTTGEEHLFKAQISFILGAHPPHKF